MTINEHGSLQSTMLFYMQMPLLGGRNGFLSLCITHKKQTGIPIFGHSFLFEALLFNLTGGMHGGM